MSPTFTQFLLTTNNAERGGEIASIELLCCTERVVSGRWKITENLRLSQNLLSHSSRPQDHHASDHRRARNRTQASRAARSPRYASHRATHLEPRGYGRPMAMPHAPPEVLRAVTARVERRQRM
jgi:hypothetical protein